MSKEPCNILVIDDEEVIHASLARVLRKDGFSLTCVLTANEGLERLQNQRFDLIITDLMMPKMDGIQLLGALQTLGLKVPIIMITGYPTIRTAVKALRLGAVDYITKPFTRREILGAIGRALRIERRDERSSEPTPDPAALIPGTVVFLPNHSWARYCQEGTFLVGIEASFIQASCAVTSLTLVDRQVEQGHVGIRIINDRGEEHGITMPLSGRVLEVNQEIFNDPRLLGPDCWLLKILPTDLTADLKLLAV